MRCRISSVRNLVLSIIIIVLYYSSNVHSQSVSCLHSTDIEIPESYQEKLNSSFSLLDQNGLNSIPVNFNFVLRSDSTGYYYAGLQEELITQLNTVFVDSKIHFYPCKQPNLIYSDDLYDLNTTEIMDLLQLGFQHHRLNVFFVDLLNNGFLCGFKDYNYHVVVNSYRCIDFNTLAHEVGHYLGLPHTFGPNSSGTAELVDGSNCETSGDFICDTPADPNRPDLVSEDCTFHGLVEDELGYLDTLRDSNGDPYKPDVRNIMSYYQLPHLCRDRFSAQQGILMNLQMEEYFKTYYNCAKYHADFSINHGSSNCEDYLEIILSTEHEDPNLVFRWDIDDDGEVDYIGTNEVSHIYTDPGFYSISLEVYYPEEDITVHRTKVDAVNFSNVNAEAPFSYDFTDGVNQNFITIQGTGDFTWEGLTLSNGENVGHNLITPNDYDALEFNIALHKMSHPVLEFDYAYHNYGNPGDTLAVQIQQCDQEPIEIFSLTGQELNTLSELGQPVKFEDWDRISLPLDDFNNQDLSIHFVTKGDSEFLLALYLDNIHIKEANINSIAQIHSSEHIHIYPNPAHEKIFIETEESLNKFSIINSRGKVIKQGPYEKMIETEDLTPGAYIILLQNDLSIYHKKFLKLD